jgi:murein DD-endopeptidase MepM/ murein hydrolase activator NlpD
MQILITHANAARTRSFSLNRVQLLAVLIGVLFVITMVSGTVYHLVFVKAAREGWPLVSPLVKLIVRDEFAQRDRYVRENLDAMAERLGQVQAKLVKLEALSERVSGLAGVPAEALAVQGAADSPAAVASQPQGGKSPIAAGGRGGPFIALPWGKRSPQEARSLEAMQTQLHALDSALDHRSDVFAFIEARLQEARLTKLLVPSSMPVQAAMTSGFGFRMDPFSGRPALHTGLDFPGAVGTPIYAAAAGVVVNLEPHAHYGQVVEIDHGAGLVTRYAHVSKRLVRTGEIVQRGQVIAHLGNTGRSTGPHLHFEVLLDGAPQNPLRFLGRP